MNLEIIPNGAIQRVHVSQNDIGRTLTFNLFNDSLDYIVPSGATVKIQGTKPSGFGFSETCTVNGNTVTIDTTEAMTDESGNIQTELSISYDDIVLGTSNFVLAVEKSPHPESTTDGTQITAQSLQVQINQLADSVDLLKKVSGGQPKAVELAEEMTDTDTIYLYLGNEEGYDYGYIYVYDNGEWVATTLYGKGEDGADGEDGYSPTVTLTEVSDGVSISVTNKNGTTTATVHDGTTTDDTYGFALEPYASFHDISDVTNFHALDTTVRSFQGCCEFDYNSNHYLAIGVIYSDGESGILLYQDGNLYNAVKGSYGHVNTLTYCDKDNKLYVGAGSNLTPTRQAFSVNALTLDDLTDLTYGSHSYWYDTYTECFYFVSNGGVYRYKYNDAPNRDDLVATITTNYTEQNVVFYKNTIFNLKWDSTYGYAHIYVYNLKGDKIAEHKLYTIVESEQIYVYDNQLYLSTNSRFYHTDSTIEREFISFKLVPNDNKNVPSMQTSPTGTVYFDDTADIYGDGTSSNPTNSAFVAFLSDKQQVQITGAFILPKYPLTRPRSFIGTSITECFINVFNAQNTNVEYRTLTVSHYTGSNSSISRTNVTFRNCIIRSDEFINNSVYIYCYQCNMIFDEVTFYNHSGALRYLFSSSYSTVNNVTLRGITIDIVSASGNTYSNTIFNSYFNIQVFNDIKPEFVILAREFQSVNKEAIESGTYDLNELLLNNITTSFANAVTVSNVPSGLSGRRVFKTVQSGTTNGLLQVLMTDSAIYHRLITGFNSVTFDSNGAITFPNVVTSNPWYAFTGTAV